MPPLIDDEAPATGAPRRGRLIDDEAAAEPSTLRKAAAVAVPMAMQVGAGLAAGPSPLQIPAQVAAGVAGEYVRQKILGEPTNVATMASSGAISAIPLPGIKQGASALGAIGRIGGAGAATAAGEELVRAPLEGRPVTLGNVLQAGAIGGVTAGVVGGGAQRWTNAAGDELARMRKGALDEIVAGAPARKKGKLILDEPFVGPPRPARPVPLEMPPESMIPPQAVAEVAPVVGQPEPPAIPASAPQPAGELDLIREAARSNPLIAEALDLLERGGTPETRQPVTRAAIERSLKDAVRYRGAKKRDARAALDDLDFALQGRQQAPGSGPPASNEVAKPEPPEVVSRRVQGLTDDAQAQPLSDRDIERAARIASRPTGRTVKARSTADRSKHYEFRFRVVSLDDIDLDDPRVQPRMRGDRIKSAEQIATFKRDPSAAQFFEGLDTLTYGGPILGPDGLPEGGNGRMRGLRELRAEGSPLYEKFQAEQRDLAEAAGIDVAALDAVPDPVIVRERVTPVRDRLAFADEVNGSGGIAGMSTFETAVRDAQRIMADGGSVLQKFDVGESDNIEDAIALARNKPAVRAFIDTIPEGERAQMSTAEGQLSTAAVQRFRGAILAGILGGDDGKRLTRAMLEEGGSGVKNAEAAIVGAAGSILRAKTKLDAYPQLNLIEDLAWATRQLSAIRRAESTVDAFLRQGDIASQLTPRRAMLLQLVGGAKSAKQIRQPLIAYFDRVAKQADPDQGTFGGISLDPPDSMAMLQEAIASAAPAPTVKGMLGKGAEQAALPAPGEAAPTVGDMFGNQRGGTPIIGDLANWLRGRRQGPRTEPIGQQGAQTRAQMQADAIRRRDEARAALKALGNRADPNNPNWKGQRESARDALRQAEGDIRRLVRKGESLQEFMLRGAAWGSEPAPGPAVRQVDADGNPIEPKGWLSSDARDWLARSSLPAGRGVESPANVGQTVAAADSVNVEAARRGVRHDWQVDEEARALAAEIAQRAETDPMGVAETIRRRGEAVNAETMRAIVDEGDRANAALVRAASRALGEGTEEAQLEALQAVAVARQWVRQAAGAKAEAGRALRILQARPTDGAATRAAVAEGLRENGITEEQLQEFLRTVVQIGDNDPIGLGMAVRVLEANKWDLLVKYRMAAMLSGPATHAANTLGNAATLSMRLGQRAAAAGFDAARARATGQPRTRYLGEVLADIEGQTAPTRAALREGGKAFREKRAAAAGAIDGLNQGVRAAAKAALNEIRASPVQSASKFDNPHMEATTRLGKVAELPLRALRLEDDIFKAAGYAGDLYARAYRQAAREGVEGYAARRGRAMEILSMPSDEIIEAASEEALYRTFQGDAGRFTRLLLGLRDWEVGNTGVRPLQLVLPFVRTPIKLASFAAENSPLQLVPLMARWNDPTLTGGALADQLGKVAVGSVIAAAAASYAAEGMLTGSGPSDDEARKALEATGWRPYSVWLGDEIGWVEYGRIDPIATIIGTTADAVEATNVEAEDMVSKLAFAFGRNWLSKNYVASLSDFFGALDDPDRKGSAFLSMLGASFSPALGARIAEWDDPVRRRPENFTQAFQARIPGQRAEVPPVRDIWGKPIKQAGSNVERFFSPFRRFVPSKDAASQEVARLGYAPGSPARELALGLKGIQGELEWTQDEYERYSEASGALAKARVERLIQLPAYKALAAKPELQRQQIAMQFQKARRAVRDAMKPGAIKRAAAEGRLTRDSVLPRVPALLR